MHCTTQHTLSPVSAAFLYLFPFIGVEFFSLPLFSTLLLHFFICGHKTYDNFACHNDNVCEYVKCHPHNPLIFVLNYFLSSVRLFLYLVVIIVPLPSFRNHTK
ncbi:hypothetical protein, unlikely [Trypanosoma brucei gambiense DAL972]|uniref:Uncharacterized protein n=1 Tax=Trypanosoma brucei gambiense (strain MHOM/CI/86/DAL972) TaxID=679716 RepID=C9ZX18_TRYB9|nr:hypothetical protein, unlikely [Trypanosoma brucei gambiense DAL972]CBH13959.1 hypothetical protein, unlikely [Trypanosoma brucei gambiense DAL972]|eukprot:XP_011776233.1 hypothetical protein, unlikely [Trypanosoma brucei gambiense DAL972]